MSPGPFLSPEFVLGATRGRWLRQPTASAPFAAVATDSRDTKPGSLFVALRGERHDGHDHVADAARAGATAVIVSRDVDPALLPQPCGVLRVDDTVAALQALGAAWRRALGCVVVAITGSAGKTTTRRLVHAVLSAGMPAIQSPRSFNNHLGVPLTLLAATPEHRAIVAEIGMNAPGEIAALADIARPEIGVVTTVGRAHLEGVGSLAGVAREKSDLLRRVRAGACRPLAVAAADVPALRPYLLGVPNLMLVGEAADAHLRLLARRPLADGQEIEVACGPGEVLRIRLRLPGKHNALNALAAVAVARHLGIADARIAERLAEVVPEAMRFQPQAVPIASDGPPIMLVNDAYNANPESMAAALTTFGEVAATATRRVLVLADMLELGPDSGDLHAEVALSILELHRQAPLASVVLVGELMAHAASELRGGRGGAGVPSVIHHAALDQSAIASIVAQIQPGDAVLLKGSRGMALERVAAALVAPGGAIPVPAAGALHR